MSKKETYQIIAVCMNCGRTPKRRTSEGKAIEPFEYKIPKGQMVKEFLFSQTCPICGCTGRLKREFS